MILSKKLVCWYLQNKRDLPWRKTKDPYRVWLSEIMLQQTRVAQGQPYFFKFTKAFPTVFDLAKADETEVLKLWQGLGYYSRARNLHFTAKFIVEELNGVFPKTYKELLKLKGVGDYTASAIASICYNEPVAVVDGNVYRVLSRYFGVNTPINSIKGIKEFKELAQTLIDETQPGVYNQAIMDFGALHCKPRNPLCNECPLADSCVALAKNQIKELPVKEKKIKIKKRYFNYLVPVTESNETVLEERKGRGIWQGLYQFPLIETQKKTNEEELIENEQFTKLFPKETTISLFNNEDIIHKLSHQHLITKFWIVKTIDVNTKTMDWTTVKKRPVPVLIDKFLEEYLNKES
ncbi:A/G-specific adenine glycosylase [Tenacibaculum sp. 1B UA]|uniref:A/G-specific adenine glycosylase n=1 Tax=Tenacibaculum sp. 1B UA TaxID=2922252 RepID=UPI002A23F406|nr:A/G-specific adenine glycosylase [Tenacibaculum sp. 1B UA]MDX8552386.1 A/G-specific adenine glycosylase [Tenacibaculum sp. 1B UA]